MYFLFPFQLYNHGGYASFPFIWSLFVIKFINTHLNILTTNGIRAFKLKIAIRHLRANLGLSNLGDYDNDNHKALT